MHGFQSRSSHGYVDPDNSAARVILREIIPLQAAHPQKAARLCHFGGIKRVIANGSLDYAAWRVERLPG
jgi:hypothetical protein